MASNRSLTGQALDPRSDGWDTPVWEPLQDLLAELVHDFMWMLAVDLEDGRRVHAYKHIRTRRYVHLDSTGAAFVCTPEGRYREVDPVLLLELALETAARLAR